MQNIINEPRVMVTYRVELVEPEGTTVNTADVNLSFRLGPDNEPVDETGRPIDDVRAYIELGRRLRRLAATNRVRVTVEELDDDHLDWKPTIVRQRFVTVPVDAETGRPIPRAR